MEKKLHIVYEWKKATKVMNDSRKEEKRVFTDKLLTNRGEDAKEGTKNKWG